MLYHCVHDGQVVERVVTPGGRWIQSGRKGNNVTTLEVHQFSSAESNYSQYKRESASANCYLQV